MIRTGELNEGVDVAVEVWGLESTWEAKSAGNGTVLGNRTMTGGQMMRRNNLGHLNLASH